MAFDGNLLKIDGEVIPSIKSYKVGRNKLWKNSERNMSGDIRATLIGIFPKIQIQTAIMTEEQMSALTEILDRDFFTVEYFDIRTRNVASALYYAADFTPELFSKSRGLYSEMEITLVPVSKRRY